MLKKLAERFTDINKLYIIVSCWTIIGIYFTMHGPLNVKFFEQLIVCNVHYSILV